MAYIKARNGPLAGRRFELGSEDAVIGRAPECDIQVDDYAVSRRHATIHEDNGNYFIEDLQSRNKTYLNDSEVAGGRHPLNNGDKLSVCDVAFNFYLDMDVPTESGLTGGSQLSVLIGSEDVGGSTIMSQLEVSSGSGQVQVVASPEATLSAILEITQNLGQALALDEVLPKVLESLFKVFVQADRAFIGLKDKEDNLVPRWSKARQQGSEETIRMSRTIVNQVMESKRAILSADAVSDDQFDANQSIADLQIRSMMCAPLFDSKGNSIGILQVDTSERQKQFRPHDLEVLVCVATQAGLAVHNAQLYEDALRQQAVKQDLKLAHEVQRGFLPSQQPAIEGYNFFDFYRPANQVGGDYFDYLQLDDNRLAVIVADVVGHGVAAALLMAKLSAEARYCLASELQPELAVHKLNNRMNGMGSDRFVSMILIVIDVQTNQLTMVNAGHMLPVHRGSDGAIQELGEDETGIPLGIMSDFEYESFEVALAAGESLTLYTDGINENCNADEEQYGDERLLQLIGSALGDAQQRGDTVLKSVLEFLGDTPPNDDMCLVTFGRDA
jgi:serine phosphatase RsbU (regulator of sigma subunit)/pSer/pThr/pTyr-binding forkhead associated (FHA) protein